MPERRGGVSRFYHADIKNNLQQTNASQGIDASKQYDAFGNVVGSSGTWTGPFGYGGAYGYQTDADSGLMLLGHRYYDSSAGRFQSRDMIHDGRNWYAYCYSSPIGRADPSGTIAPFLLYGAYVLGASLVGGVIGYFTAEPGQEWEGAKGGAKIGAFIMLLALIAWELAPAALVALGSQVATRGAQRSGPIVTGPHETLAAASAMWTTEQLHRPWGRWSQRQIQAQGSWGEEVGPRKECAAWTAISDFRTYGCRPLMAETYSGKLAE